MALNQVHELRFMQGEYVLATTMKSLRVASFQKSESSVDTDGVVSGISDDVVWADQNGADVCLFPEAYLTGYPKDARSVAETAISLDSKRIQRFLEIVRQRRATLVVGFIERGRHECFNSAMVVRGGEILGVYRKQHPNEAGISAGTQGLVFGQGRFSIGINICNDANFAGASRQLAELGANVIFYPLNNMLKRATAERWRQRTKELLSQRAKETNCWVVSADVTGDEGEYISFGCTAIVSPDGEHLKRMEEFHTGGIMFDIPLE